MEKKCEMHKEALKLSTSEFTSSAEHGLLRFAAIEAQATSINLATQETKADQDSTMQ